MELDRRSLRPRRYPLTTDPLTATVQQHEKPASERALRCDAVGDGGAYGLPPSARIRRASCDFLRAALFG